MSRPGCLRTVRIARRKGYSEIEVQQCAVEVSASCGYEVRESHMVLLYWWRWRQVDPHDWDSLPHPRNQQTQAQC